jgi:hypothetical protein
MGTEKKRGVQWRLPLETLLWLRCSAAVFDMSVGAFVVAVVRYVSGDMDKRERTAFERKMQECPDYGIVVKK